MNLINYVRVPKHWISIRAISVACIGFFSLNSARASVTINYEVAEITSAGTKISAGTLFFISHGVDNLFQSSTWAANSTSFIVGDDLLFAAVPILNGVAAGAIADFALPANTVANTTKLTGLFVSGLTSSQINYSTGQLTGGLKFGVAGGTSYGFGSYRNDSIEAFGGSTAGKIGWIFPADGSTVDLFSYSNTGDYSGASLTASLSTSSSLIVIPEPTAFSLVAMALGLSLNSRRRRIS